MSPLQTLLCILPLLQESLSDTTVTIFKEFLSQGGRVSYEVDRWNKHNGLTTTSLIPNCKSIGTEAGRIINRDIALFPKWPQDPNRQGYPDPMYLKDPVLQKDIWNKYMEDIHGYGHDINMVLETRSTYWPQWINTSQHPLNDFPNNIYAAAEFAFLMVQGLHNYSEGHIPPYFEVINEPFNPLKQLDTQTVLDYHKAVAQKLKTKFRVKVGGPTYTFFSTLTTDASNFSTWERTTEFIDLIPDQMDFFSFHAYNNFWVNGDTHHFTGLNEARLVAFVDMVENYAHITKGRNVPLIISEFGRNAIYGIDKWASSELVTFATVFQSSAHLFTILNLREFIDRAVVFLLSNEGPTTQGGLHNSTNYSLFTKEGKILKNANHFKFWQHIGNDHKFLKSTSQCTGYERSVSPLALANPKNKELVILLVNYANSSQIVHLDFDGDWINPTTGQSTCLLFENGTAEMKSNVPFDTTKNDGGVILPGEAICMYKFNTTVNFYSLRTVNETTYYGMDMVIPINNRQAQTTIHLPSFSYHTAHMRIGVSRGNRNQKAKPTSVTINGSQLPSTYMLFDSEINENTTRWNVTRWEVWEYPVPIENLKTTNTINMQFDESGGHVSSVALAVGELQ